MNSGVPAMVPDSAGAASGSMVVASGETGPPSASRETPKSAMTAR